jgi:hypothetical protein
MLLARDGPAGRIQDLYFEDAAWRARFLVAQTGRWPAGIQVVIPPYAAIRIDTKLKALEVDLTRLEIERNPVLDTEMPVSVRLRSAQLDTVGAPMYLGFEPRTRKGALLVQDRAPHLRSARLVTGYHVLATDGDLGHVIDLVVDDSDWTIPYLLTDTTQWRFGRPRLVATTCVDRIEAASSRILLRVSRGGLDSHPNLAAPANLPDIPIYNGDCPG